MSDIKRNFEMTFENKNTGERKTIEVVSTDKESAYSKAREKALEKKDFPDTISQFEKEFSRKITSVSFHNTPWENNEELIQTIRGFNSVSYCRFIAPLEGSYGPPSYFISPSDGYTKDDVISDLNDYFEGFEFRENGSRVTAVLSST